MYIDTIAGNDTNSGEISTSVGGWFYLVAANDSASDTNYYTGFTGDDTDLNWESGTAKAKANGTDATKTDYYYIEIDNPDAGTDGQPAKLELKLYTKYYGSASSSNQYNLNMVKDGTVKYKDINGDGALDEGEYYTVKQKSATTTTNATTGAQEVTQNYFSRLSNLLYEVVPDFGADTSVSYNNGGHNIYKVYSEAIPFVNGAFTLPGDAITNIFANAKISVQVSFQAVQAFLPYTTEIDGITDGDTDTRLGSEKALTIQNAIYIFNEAFDYSSSGSGFDDSNL